MNSFKRRKVNFCNENNRSMTEIFEPLKNLLVLIYSKLHSKTCDYLYKFPARRQFEYLWRHLDTQLLHTKEGRFLMMTETI